MSERALETSFIISHMIVKNKKAHTFGENLMKPTCEKIVRIMPWDEATSEIGKVSHSVVPQSSVKNSYKCIKTLLKVFRINMFTQQVQKDLPFWEYLTSIL